MANDDEKRRFFIGFVGSLAAGLVTTMIVRNLTQPRQVVPYLAQAPKKCPTCSAAGWKAD